MVKFSTILITIAIVLAGIGLISFGISILDAVNETPTNLDEPWQSIVNFGADFAFYTGWGILIFGIIVIVVGVPIYLIFFG